jgi:Zn-dependent M28 family amino/carboxypeptidase
MSRRTQIILVTALVALAALVAVAAWQGPSLQAATPLVEQEQPGLAVYDTMAAISDGIGPRVAGSAAEQEAAEYITTRLNDAGYTSLAQDFTFAGKSSRNIVAVKAGVTTQRIVIGAHYDSVKVGRGAFDNASGVALMLELATALQGQPTPYTLVFVAFGAEEVGLKGSAHFVKTMSAQEKADTVLMLNFDSVAAGDRMYAYSSAEQAWPQLMLRQLARAAGETILTNPQLNKDYPYGTTGDWSDHVAFKRAGIPYLYLEATNWLLGENDGYLNTRRDGEIWHSQKDTVAYIEQRYPGRMGEQLQAEFDALMTFLQEQLPVAQ